MSMKLLLHTAAILSLLLALYAPAHTDEFRPLDTSAMDESLFMDSYAILGMERLMHPIDMADWPLKITAERQLFVDDYLLASAEGVIRTVHQPTPHPGNPVLRMFEFPWDAEDGFSVFVLRDEPSGQFRMWYNTKLMYHADNGIRYRGSTCYAVSKDGVHWTKPALGAVTLGHEARFRHSWRKQLQYPDPEFAKQDASPDRNNIALAEGSIQGLFFEPDEPDTQKRYKALVWHDPRGQKEYAPREGLYTYHSPDGIHWEGDNQTCTIPLREGYQTRFPDEMVPGIGDTTNLLWDPKLQKYVCNAKILFRHPTTRMIGHSESDDLVHWTRPILTMHRDRFDGEDQIGEITRIPYESMWIGLLGIYHWPEGKWKQKYLQLAASRDGRNWSRVNRGEAFIPLGPEDSWDPDFTIAGRPGPLLLDDELWFYYLGMRRMERYESEGIDMPHIQHVGLAKLRRDGFVSLDAGNPSGEVTTRPLSFTGSRLYVNASVEQDGYLKVGLLSRDGEPLAGWGLGDAIAVSNDGTKIPMMWNRAQEIKLPPDGHVRLQFELKNAQLYSFWVE